MGALATLGITAGSALLGSYLDKRAQDRAFEQNKQFWHERFDKEAQYNSPVQQKARMQAAGLNPALMYKGGQTGGNVSGGSAQGKIAERYQLTELARMSAEVQKIKADTKKTISEEEFIKSKTEGQGTTNKIAVQNLAIKQIEASNADAKIQLSLKNDLMTVLNQVEKYNTQVQQTGLTAEQRQNAKNLNYKFDKLEKKMIDAGIDVTSGPWQTFKQYFVNQLGPWAKETMDLFMNPAFGQGIFNEGLMPTLEKF
jgi:hypothetical protein